MDHTNASGVSWAPVIAGAFITASLSLALLALGAGFGLLSVSPWSSSRVSETAVDAAAIVWLILIEIVAAGAGGYLAGRLRTKWVAIHDDEVYFRDTAHGLLVWAVAVVITAAFLGSAATAMVGGAAASASQVSAFESDSLPALSVAANSSTELTSEDQAYLAHMLSAKTGMSENAAARRVSDVLARNRAAADATRRATARLLLWTFLALLIGAFSASFAATIGGRQRDHMKAV